MTNPNKYLLAENPPTRECEETSEVTDAILEAHKNYESAKAYLETMPYYSEDTMREIAINESRKGLLGSELICVGAAEITVGEQSGMG